MKIICESIQDNIGALFKCSEINQYVRVRTPFLFPDGDVIDIFAKQQGELVSLTDLGETVRWLRMQSLSQRRSPKQLQLIEDICLNHGIEFFKGMLILRVRPGEDISSAIMRLAQACLRVSDLWFTFRTRAVETIADEIADFLTEKVVPFERSERLAGRSGQIWRPDFHTRTPKQSSLIYVLSTGSKAAARGVAEHVLAAWYDLSHYTAGPEALKFISLFDDTVDVWTEKELNLVSDLSDIAIWSRPDDLYNKIAA
jgi:hypothetical protein